MERLDFCFINNTPTKTTFELFSSFNTLSQVTNKNLVVPNIPYIPFPVYPPPLDVVKLKGNVLFNQYGDLIILEDTNGDIACQIQCQTYPYRSVLNALMYYKIMIKKIRISTSSSPQQLITQITRFEQRPLTNEAKKEVYPVTISPQNVQPLLNIFEKDILIDGKSGLLYAIQPNEVVYWTIEFEFIN